jgi:hypothetical protein
VNRVLDEDGRTDYDPKSKLKKRDKGLVRLLIAKLAQAAS